MATERVDILIIHIVIGLIAVILFRYKNPHRYLLDFVSIFVFAVFVSTAVIELTDWGLHFWFVAALGLVSTYIGRFVRQKDIRCFDWIKLSGILVLIFYPFSAFNFEGRLETIEYYLENLIIPVVGTIYIYDRLILKTEMKRRFIVILSVQSILILVLLIFSIVQDAEADKQRVRADGERKKAESLYYELVKLKAQKENNQQQ